MTDVPLPIRQPEPIETLRLPRRLYALVIAAIMVAAVSATASILGSLATRDSNIIEQEDLLRNREYLRATCENTRAITERFISQSPAPCPTDFP